METVIGILLAWFVLAILVAIGFGFLAKAGRGKED